MADSTVMDISKMKVVDLRKELKSRGLSYTGDKAELVARLQAAMSQDDHGDINLDSDEIDSDGVLEEEDDKSQADMLDDSGVDHLNEELALSEQPTEVKPVAEPKTRQLKRKIPTETLREKSDDKSDNKDVSSKKIVLNRAISVGDVIDIAVSKNIPKQTEEEKDKKEELETDSSTNNKVKITADLDAKTRLEMRAKRFGLPVKMSDNERKEARKQRFGQTNAAKNVSTITASSGTLTENMDKLKKRAERFGESVSKIMTDIENKEKLEKRKAKFGGVA